MSFNVGDKVAVYDCTDRSVGFINEIDREDNTLLISSCKCEIELDDSYWVHPNQCRKIVKKEKFVENLAKLHEKHIQSIRESVKTLIDDPMYSKWCASHKKRIEESTPKIVITSSLNESDLEDCNICNGELNKAINEEIDIQLKKSDICPLCGDNCKGHKELFENKPVMSPSTGESLKRFFEPTGCYCESVASQEINHSIDSIREAVTALHHQKDLYNEPVPSHETSSFDRYQIRLEYVLEKQNERISNLEKIDKINSESHNSNNEIFSARIDSLEKIIAEISLACKTDDKRINSLIEMNDHNVNELQTHLSHINEKHNQLVEVSKAENKKLQDKISDQQITIDSLSKSFKELEINQLNLSQRKDFFEAKLLEAFKNGNERYEKMEEQVKDLKPSIDMFNHAKQFTDKVVLRRIDSLESKVDGLSLLANANRILNKTKK